MNIADEERKVFDDWRARRRNFVQDGVVDEAQYEKSKPRLLFVLKEVNDKSGEFRDLVGFLREGGLPRTWDNVARWTRGLQRLGEDLSWTDLEDAGQFRRDMLQSICAMNLKKWAGGYTTNSQELEQAVEDDHDLIQRQYLLYHAEITVCCGSSVAWGLAKALEIEDPSAWQMTKRGIRFTEQERGRVIVAFAHPEARVSDCLLYYGLVDACREIQNSPR